MSARISIDSVHSHTASMRVIEASHAAKPRNPAQHLLARPERPCARALQLKALRDQSHPIENPSEAEKLRSARLRQSLDAVLSVPSRIDSGKKLVETLKKLIRIKREIYDITAASPEDKSQHPTLTDTERTSRLLALLAIARQRAQQ